MVKLMNISVLTKAPFEMVKITEEVHKVVEECEIKNGVAAVITSHTTTGIIVNEGLRCVEVDIEEMLDRLVPDNMPYAHAHFLPSYGATGNNSVGHLKSALVGNNCMFPVIDGKIVCGSAQDIYLAEFDGPQLRKVYIEVIGE